MKSLKAFGGQYMNEILSLLVMALMAVALVAAQAQTLAPEGAGFKNDQNVSEIRLTISVRNGHESNEGY